MSWRVDEQVASFSTLYRNTSSDILCYLARRCPTADDAADCLAETYLVAWRKRHQIPAGGDARPWLFGVARNVMRRSRERQAQLDIATQALANRLEAAGDHCPPPSVPEVDPVISALRLLPEIDQEILELLCWDCLKPREVALILDLSANVVRVRAHRARTRLRSLLRDHTFDEMRTDRRAAEPARRSGTEAALHQA